MLFLQTVVKYSFQFLKVRVQFSSSIISFCVVVQLYFVAENYFRCACVVTGLDGKCA